MTFLNSIFIIFATSLLTAIFSFWRSRSERWWELKVATYSNIMQSLHHIKKRSDMYFDDYMDHLEENAGEVINEDEMVRNQGTVNTTKSIENAGEAALQEIERIIDASSFIVKQQALEELIKLRATYGWKVMHIDEAIESIEKEKKAVDSCIENMKIIAKSDLETIIDKFAEKISSYSAKLNKT